MYTTIRYGVESRIGDLHADAAHRRLENEARKANRQNRRPSLAILLRSIRATLSRTDRNPVLPRLSDYPYRS
jgi:hypothetical protein